MPQPYPGQEWKHGWIPLTAGSARSKNHGRKPGAGSLLSRMVAEAAETHKRINERDAERDRTSPAAKTATPKKSGTPKAGAKVGDDSHGKPVRVSDEVRLTGGRGEGKNARVVSKGRSGTVRVATEDGQEIDAFRENIRNRADHEASRKADSAIRQAAGRPTGTTSKPTPSGSEIQDRIRDAYKELAREPADWVKLDRLRARLGKDLPREAVDEVLRRMMIDPKVKAWIVPEADQKALTPAQRAAAIHVGGVDRHMIAMQ